ncbi:leucyl/phenylalanyl-tRNA--protein transferase [Desulfonatronovibrio magnus]|uniref:leucyl/phenylalanyl-tRNA--protein transferase n=1 Tax=Desulfonatronovibrio magnus TaxID=698827 RepID=UPI0005EBE7D5|nr:leucyl/phenylalanyl-tRNA--protein transferase [Desulfonatronovibrio magnus]RQD55528.1 MAG: leucyl/phenylalanyl-tRNA--protein transferase [Desulfonatronovibrio sp. MSAO_Bac4]
MSVSFLTKGTVFPHPENADPDGLLAIGGDLSEQRLLNAYSKGIFPWYSPGSPILWWAPSPRLILYPEKLHISRSLRRTLNSGRFTVTADRAFERVIEYCAGVSRPDGNGTWIVPEMMDAYIRLHKSGYAHSVEVWSNNKLAGGVYGVSLGKAFFGESMFYFLPDASKVALVKLVGFLAKNKFHFIDCQQTTQHMLRFGAEEVSGRIFYHNLQGAVVKKGLNHNWQNIFHQQQVNF